MSEKVMGFVEALRGKNASWVTGVIDALGEVTVTVPRDAIADACFFLRSDHDFHLLADICGADRGPEEDPRFEVNYHLFSTVHFQRLRLKVLVSEDDPHVETVTMLWRTA